MAQDVINGLVLPGCHLLVQGDLDVRRYHVGHALPFVDLLRPFSQMHAFVAIEHFSSSLAEKPPRPAEFDACLRRQAARTDGAARHRSASCARLPHCPNLSLLASPVPRTI